MSARRTAPPAAFLLLALPFLISAAPQNPADAPEVIAIRGGTVLTMAGAPIEGGTVLIRGGKIAAVGRRVNVPEGARVIDAGGKTVMPGLIDAMTYFGIRPFALNDRSRPLTPENRIIQAYYPFGRTMHDKRVNRERDEILSGGVTTVYIAPGDKQVIGGQGAVIKTWGEDFDRFTLREPAAIDMALGDPPKRSGGAAPATRMGVASMLRKTLLGARAFERARLEYEEKTDEEKEKAAPPPRDLGKEALVRLLNREIPARMQADFVDDIRTALRIAEEFGFVPIIDSGLGAYKIKDLLAQKSIPVVLGPPSHPFVYGGEVSMTPRLYREMSETAPAQLIEAGVTVAVASFGFGFGSFGYATQGRWLLIEAALLTAHGVSDEDALRAVTINPARILGIDDRVGSLEPGKDADVIILDGDPLSVKTWVEQVLIDGRQVYRREGVR